MNTYCEGGSQCRGVEHSAYTALFSASRLLIQDHIHLPLVALVAQWGLLANIEGLCMVVQGAK
jgi:hypothetical protein